MMCFLSDFFVENFGLTCGCVFVQYVLGELKHKFRKNQVIFKKKLISEHFSFFTVLSIFTNCIFLRMMDLYFYERNITGMKHTVIITGASRGIGRACALEFARKGYSLFLTSYRHPKLLEETAELARKYGGTVITAPNIDIGDYKSCKEMIWDKICERNLKIDILVNNAGISHIGLLQDMSYEEWKTVIDVNLGSVFTMCRHVIPLMQKSGCGKIVNISSVWGNTGASCEVAYSASKGGINSFTKALAKELAPSNIQVNAVAFGAIDTDMNQFLNEEERNMLIQEIPAGRIASPEEAAQFISALTDCGTYLTGQVIAMDGGWC